MGAEKGIFIAEIAEGREVEGILLVKELNRGETRAGKPFLRLTLVDNSGEIGGPVWDDAEELAPLCQPGSYLQVSGRGDSYQGSPQLKIGRISPVDPSSVDPADFMPSGDFDRRELEAELERLLAGVQSPPVRRLLDAFFSDREFYQRFTTAPAAKSMHHAYLGGLLEHTVAVARLAEAVSRLYPGLDADLLLAGALLHDLGKTEELTYREYPFGYSNRGRLVGHLVIGTEMISQKAAAIDDFPPELLERLQHLVLSHHGYHEFGTPTLPMMQEAFILHFLDNLDAKANYFHRLNRQTTEPGYQWSDYQRNLERFLYLPGPAQEPGQEPGRNPGPESDPPPAPRQATRKKKAAPRPDPPAAPPAMEDESSNPVDPRQKPLWG